jgi:hypothetical protein
LRTKESARPQGARSPIWAERRRKITDVAIGRGRRGRTHPVSPAMAAAAAIAGKFVRQWPVKRSLLRMD